MRLGIFTLFFLFISTGLLVGQNQNHSGLMELNYGELMKISSQNPEIALSLVDSLYIYASTEEFKAEILMMSADILAKSNRIEESIDYAQRALRISRGNLDYSAQARIYCFLSEQYRKVGLYRKGEYFIERALEVTDKLKGESSRISYQAQINEELARYAYEKGDYENSLSKMQHAGLLYGLLQREGDYNLALAKNRAFTAKVLLKLDKPEEALQVIYSSRDYFFGEKTYNPKEAAYIYQSLGKVFLKNNKVDSAEVYLIKARDLIVGDLDKDMEIRIINELKEYSRVTENMEDYILYAEKQDSLSKSLDKFKKNVINHLTEERPIVEDKKKESFSWPALPQMPAVDLKPVLFGLGIFLFGGLLGFLIIRKRNTNENPASVNVEPASSISHGTKERVVDTELNKENVEKLERKLKEFEDQMKFLSKEMSFSTMVGELDTNEKYLNRYLKENLKTNYNTYINEKRIYYIVDKLKNDPAWRSYKLTYLADESGFSSYSAFTVNFKNIMKESPSTYIGKLK